MIDKDAALRCYRPYLDDRDYSPEFLVTHRNELERVLSGVQRSRELIAVYLQGSDKFFLSTILGLDFKNNLLYLDISNQSDVNRQVQTSTQGLIIHTKPNDIQTLFLLQPPTLTSLEGMNVFSTPLPGHMMRLQRREFMRVSPSGDDALNCTLHVEHRTLSASIQDISEGGLGLTTSHLPEGLKIGDVMPECYFDLPGENRVEYDLRIKRITANTEDSPYPVFNLGCEYVNPNASATAQLRQFIWKQERSSRAADKS